MPKKRPESSADGFKPIEVKVGVQNAPIVSEVDFSTQTPATTPAKQEPQPAANIKED